MRQIDALGAVSLSKFGSGMDPMIQTVMHKKANGYHCHCDSMVTEFLFKSEVQNSMNNGFLIDLTYKTQPFNQKLYRIGLMQMETAGMPARGFD